MIHLKKIIRLGYRAIGYKNFNFFDIENMDWTTGYLADAQGRYIDHNNHTLVFKDSYLKKVDGQPYSNSSLNSSHHNGDSSHQNRVKM
jgi:hypothetical protein